MNEFDKVMSERSDLELYEILNHKRSSYTSEALVSAKTEFNARNISSKKLSELELQSRENNKANRTKQKAELVEKIKDVWKLFLPTEKDTLSQNLLSFCIFLTIAYIYYFISDFSLTIAVLSDFREWDVSVIEHLLPLLLFPIGIFGLWKTKKYGWFLIVALLTYYAFSAVYSGIDNYSYSFGDNGGIFGQLDNVFPKPSIPSLILRFVVLGGLVIFLHRTNILKLFKIKKSNRIAMVVVIGVLTTLFWWSIR